MYLAFDLFWNFLKLQEKDTFFKDLKDNEN